MDSAVTCQFANPKRMPAGIVERESPAHITKRLRSDLGAYSVCPTWKPQFNVLLVFVCCLSSSFALNVIEPPTPSYRSWRTILGGVPSTSPPCLQSVPLLRRNSPLKTKLETPKLSALLLKKRSPKINLSNIDFKKPWRVLCVNCEKAHAVMSPLTDHSALLTSLNQSGQKMKETSKAVGKHPGCCKKLQSKRSAPLEASLAQNEAVRHRDWVDYLFGVEERLPAQSSVDEKKISGVSERLDASNGFNFDDWEESFQNLLRSSVENVESSIKLNPSVHLDGTFGSVTPAKGNLEDSAFGPEAEAGIRALPLLVTPLTLTETGRDNVKAVTLVPSATPNTLSPQFSEIHVGSLFTMKQPKTLNSDYNFRTAFSTATSASVGLVSKTGFIVQRTTDLYRVTADTVSPPRLRYIESNPIDLGSTARAALLHSSMTDAMNHTLPGIAKVLPIPLASVSKPNSSFDVSASDHGILPVTSDSKSSGTRVSTVAPFEHATMPDRMLLVGGPLNSHTPAPNLLENEANSIDQLRVSTYSPPVSPTAASLSVTTDAQLNANVGSSGPLPTQPFKLGVGVMIEESQSDYPAVSHSTSGHGFEYNQPSPSFGSTLIRPIIVKNNASVRKGTAPTTNNFSNFISSNSLPGSLPTPYKNGPYLGLSNPPNSLEVSTRAGGKKTPIHHLTVVKTETAESGIPPFTSSSISEASGKEHIDWAIDRKSNPLHLVTSGPSAGAVNFSPGRNTLSSLPVTLKTPHSGLDSSVSVINDFGDPSATSMFYSPQGNVPHDSQQRFNIAVTPLAPVKQAHSVPAGLTVPLTTGSFHFSNAGTAHSYDSSLTTKRNSYLASEGTSPSLPELSNAIHVATSETIVLGSRISLNPIYDRVKTERYPLPRESVATPAVNLRTFTSVSIRNATIKTSDTVQQHEGVNSPSILPTGNTQFYTSPVIPFFANQHVRATGKNNRIKRALTTQYLSLLSSESYFSSKRASTPKCESCIFSNSPRPVSASLDTGNYHESSIAYTKPYSSFSFPKWVTSLDGSFVRRPLTKVVASTNDLVPARASSVDPTLSSYVTLDNARAGLSTVDTLTELTIINNLFNSKRDAVKFSPATPHKVLTAYSLLTTPTDAAHLVTSGAFIIPFTEAPTQFSFVKESKISTTPNYLTSIQSTKALRVKPTKWKSSLSTVPLTHGFTSPFYTFIGWVPSGSGFPYNSVTEQSRSSISAASSLPDGVQNHSSLNLTNEAATMPTTSSYYTSSIQVSSSLASDPSLSAKPSEIKVYGSHSPVTNSTRATKRVFSTSSNAAVSTLGISPTGILSFNESLNTANVHTIKTLGDHHLYDGWYTSSTASGAAVNTHIPTGSHLTSALIASASIVARTAAKEANSAPHSIVGYQWTTPHSSTREMAIQKTSPSVVTSPYSTVMRNNSLSLQKTTDLDKTIWTFLYSTYKTNDSTNFHQQNPATFTKVTSLYNTPTKSMSTGFEQTTLYDSTESTLLHSPVSARDDLDFSRDKIGFNHTALATSSHSTVPIPPHPTSTIVYSSTQSPVTLLFLQPNSTVLQSSQSGVRSSLLIPSASTHRLHDTSMSPSRPALTKFSTWAKLSSRKEPSNFSLEKTSRQPESASSQVLSTALLPRSLVTAASLAPQVHVSKIFTNAAQWSTKMNNPLNHTPLTFNITLLANTSDSLPRTNTESKQTLSTPASPVLPTVIQLKCLLTGILYSLELQNQSSPAYMALAREVQLTMNKIFSAKYGSDYFGTRIKDFRNGSVIAELDILFQNNTLPPSSSDVVRTVLTEAHKMTDHQNEWRIALPSVESNGHSLKNLEPEQVSISFLALGMGFAAFLNNSDNPLENLKSEVLRILRQIVSLKQFLLVEVRNLRGDLSIKGDLYINTSTHVDTMQILQALRSLVNHSVDLSSIAVAGDRLDLQIYPLRIRILNRALTAQMMDHSAMVFQQFSKDLGTTVLDILKKGVPPLQMVVREFQSGSVLMQGELIFQSPAPPSKEVLQTLIDSVGSGNVFGRSSFLVDPTSFVVADAKSDLNAEDRYFPGFAVAIIVMCGLAIISIPFIIFLFIKTNVFRHHGKAIIQRPRDPERGQYNLELTNRGYQSRAV
ncbi:uncharacterized protein LOC144826600 [Lissotriton helveticus]